MMSTYNSSRRQGDTKSNKTRAAQAQSETKRKFQTEEGVVKKAVKVTLDAARDRFFPGANGKKIFMPWEREELIADLVPRHIVHSNSALSGLTKEEAADSSIDGMVERGYLVVSEDARLYRLNESLMSEVS